MSGRGGGGAPRSGRPSTALARIVGRSHAIGTVRTELARVAQSPGRTVLVVGESGTGKGLLARVLHDASPRAARRFEIIRCAALPETLLESELFGHEAGAFTDARRRKRGLVEIADGGTVFLDEIGSTGFALQAALLDFLEERTFKRVGGTEDIGVDVRVVAATNCDLERAVAERSFRADLYFRLAVLVLRVPPLRERLEDVPLLVAHFVAKLNRELGLEVSGVTPEALAQLEAHDWPGNIRELRNLIERAALLARGPLLGVEELRPDPPVPRAGRLLELPAEGLELARLEADLIAQAIERAHGNRSHAARLLGLTRHQMRYRLDKLRLEGAVDVDPAAPARRVGVRG